ncbi:hypothetical protein GSI_05798 [Ganoderma sinense ZZ0214-1]|uniref:F-box domain-containing protein n=1 Tax=Ganoderma sinense ZZ0214-1 TaxID=1077348 RepID=A0A2G8SBJ0_9APHY|nr:hypothetical protein GSI_05798 [Ganoderma sinense ZZ0214-1]
MAPVDLWKGDLVNSFHTFIFSNEQSRAPCIYGLKIQTSYYDFPYTDTGDFPIISDRLVAILEAAPHIQYLDFRTSVSDFVFNAIVKLTAVRELRIFPDVPAFHEQLHVGLTTFRSPLRSLRITGIEPTGGTIPASFLLNCLSHLAPTLEFLDLDDFPVDVPPSSVTTQFSAVRSLKLHTAFHPDHDLLGVLVRLFPNLDDTLELSLPMYMGEDSVHAFRDRCEESQRQQCWPGLDRLVCNAGNAYLLALRCPIRRMDIEVRFPGATSYLAKALRHNCPRHLHVRITSYDGFGALDGLFPPDGSADKLTHLVVFADIAIRHGRRSSGRNRLDDHVHFDRCVKRLLRSLKHLRLTQLRVVFRFTIFHQVRKAMPDADSVAHIGDRVDLRLTADRFVDAMPTLQCLFLTSCGQAHSILPKKRGPEFNDEIPTKWFTSKAWSVGYDHDKDFHLSESDSDVGLGSCVELSMEAAERIMDREELQLSPDEKYEVRLCVDPKGS